MSGLNKFLPFAQGTGANVLTDAAYAADSQLPVGNQPGIARSALNNKALRQGTVMAAALAQFIADRQSADITDTLTASQIEGYLQTALATTSSLPGNISNSSSSWWRKSSDGYIEQGIAGISVPAMGGFTAVTFPIAFVTTVLDIQVSVYNAAHEQCGWSTLTLTGCDILTGSSDTLPRVVNILVRGY